MKTVIVLFLALNAAAAAGVHKDNEEPPIEPRTTLDCGKHKLDAGVYYIESPNHPGDYTDGIKCKYIIRARDRSDVDMACEAFDLEDDKRCSYDFLRVNRVKYCGTDAPPAASARVFKIVFRTDVDTVATGFRCSFSVGGVTTSSTAATTSASTAVSTQSTTSATTAATTAPPSESCCCGVPNRSSRIVGGEETEVYEYPWQAGLVSTGGTRTWCGGTIINSRYVLSAAHCTVGEQAGDIEVLIKEHRISNSDGEIRKTVQQIINHPSYTSASRSGYDFSLLKLTDAITFPSDNTVAPACLPTAGNLFVGADAIVTGWGATSQGGSQATTLQEVTVPVLSNEVCRQSYSSINPSMICAGLSQGGKDSCQGDSGGPMVSLENDRYSVIGVVSWGRGCARPGYPGVYARVTEVLSWIQSNTSEGEYCS